MIQDDQTLREAIHELCIKFRREEGPGWVDRTIEDLNAIMDLITSDKEKAVREAYLKGSIDELAVMPRPTKDMMKYWRFRKQELKERSVKLTPSPEPKEGKIDE